MARPATRPTLVYERELALRSRLAALSGVAGFEWRPEAGDWLWSPGDGAGGIVLKGLDELMGRCDGTSEAQLRAVLSALSAGATKDETLDLALGDGGASLRLRLRREDDATGILITGLICSTPAERAPAVQAVDAHIDMLTGLCNRRGLQADGAEAVRTARRDGRMLALLFLDLDRFKQVNDSLGHHAGDELLRVVARRLRDCVRGSDVVARQSGDEFVVVLSQLQRPQDAAFVAQKVLETLLRPTQIAGQTVTIGCSIGIALLSESCPDLPALLRAADTAMYAAKEAGRNTFRFFHDAYFLRLQRRAELEQELKRALAREELFLLYQPSIRLQDRRLVSVEALLRWRTSDGEVRSPAEFLPLAQESGDIVAIGDWVLREACRQARSWKEKGLIFDRVTVNISAQELRDASLPARVAEICEDTGWPPAMLELELTDAALLQDRDASRRALSALAALGVHVALDDFGTGVSNLIYLHRFQVRALKLDRHFALGMQDDPALQQVVQAVIAMGHSLQLRLVAKGVESAFAADFLTERGCDEAQGYHFARPMPAADVPLWSQSRDLAQLTASAGTTPR